MELLPVEATGFRYSCSTAWLSACDRLPDDVGEFVLLGADQLLTDDLSRVWADAAARGYDPARHRMVLSAEPEGGYYGPYSESRRHAVPPHGLNTGSALVNCAVMRDGALRAFLERNAATRSHGLRSPRRPGREERFAM